LTGPAHGAADHPRARRGRQCRQHGSVRRRGSGAIGRPLRSCPSGASGERRDVLAEQHDDLAKRVRPRGCARQARPHARIRGSLVAASITLANGATASRRNVMGRGPAPKRWTIRAQLGWSAVSGVMTARNGGSQCRNRRARPDVMDDRRHPWEEPAMGHVVDGEHGVGEAATRAEGRPAAQQHPALSGHAGRSVRPLFLSRHMPEPQSWALLCEIGDGVCYVGRVAEGQLVAAIYPLHGDFGVGLAEPRCAVAPCAVHVAGVRSIAA
jgi:hypothetical protein